MEDVISESTPNSQELELKIFTCCTYDNLTNNQADHNNSINNDETCKANWLRIQSAETETHKRRPLLRLTIGRSSICSTTEEDEEEDDNEGDSFNPHSLLPMNKFRQLKTLPPSCRHHQHQQQRLHPLPPRLKQKRLSLKRAVSVDFPSQTTKTISIPATIGRPTTTTPTSCSSNKSNQPSSFSCHIRRALSFTPGMNQRRSNSGDSVYSLLHSDTESDTDSDPETDGLGVTSPGPDEHFNSPWSSSLGQRPHSQSLPNPPSPPRRPHPPFHPPFNGSSMSPRSSRSPPSPRSQSQFNFNIAPKYAHKPLPPSPLHPKQRALSSSSISLPNPSTEHSISSRFFSFFATLTRQETKQWNRPSSSDRTARERSNSVLQVNSPVPPNLVQIEDLKPGDIVIVSSFNAVAASLAISRLFTQERTRRGSANSVHCMLVVNLDGESARVAHVVRSGAELNYIAAYDKERIEKMFPLDPQKVLARVQTARLDFLFPSYLLFLGFVMTLLLNIIPYYAYVLVLFCFVLFCFVLFYFVLFCFVLFCFVLFCFVLFCFPKNFQAEKHK